MPITLNSSFSDIADAIRELRGTSRTYTPGQMAAEIIRYNDPNYINITVNSINGISNPSSVWTSGSDQDVLNMVGLAMRGDIDLTDYWSVGDTRSVSISAMSATGVGESHTAQTVEMVLMHANPDMYTYVTTPSSGRTKPFFIYGQKDCLATTGYMNSEDTNSGSWNSTARKTWCDAVYRNAVPAYLKTITKQVSFITGVRNSNNSTSGDSNQSCTGYFFLPAEKEVFGLRTYSTSNEANPSEQWMWYATSANRIKKLGTSGSANTWWERSPRYNSSYNFCYVTTSGSASSSGSNGVFGLAPCGSI